MSVISKIRGSGVKPKMRSLAINLESTLLIKVKDFILANKIFENYKLSALISNLQDYISKQYSIHSIKLVFIDEWRSSRHSADKINLFTEDEITYLFDYVLSRQITLDKYSDYVIKNLADIKENKNDSI